ncbi:cryptochrome/photolyase family protein [Jannaschia seohaensis]|uniref:Deoxyribodipyrimidine photo-lyase n=1 Tax=Jannaschia seohaensis TaxID=475081 RepID=A0A2Y9AQ93_9RHOB|nr:deoxyribodipyrimidine photo-lyase [Jannaschia seohaensis]PWJ20521.1 deoxyribodipyrimidine photo-lyase [Jannaschia seohaensis]SSA44617.1 deoxyribodipyrimidine photo-lyase [Jannaschia seohaensis]
MAPILYWIRRDLRLSDNPALTWAKAQGRPIIPVFLLDQVVEGWGAAPRWRLGLGLEAHAAALEAVESRLTLRRGPALDTLRGLVAETGADTVVWNRLYTADERARDTEVKEALRGDGLTARSFNGHVLFEPWTVETGSGGFYRVYTPFWKNVRDRDPGETLAAPATIPAPEAWPETDALDDWDLGRAMRRGADVVAQHVHVGESSAQARLGAFIAHKIDGYDIARDMLAEDGTSGLSENLTYGEISARTCWHAGQRAMAEGKAGAETFLKEVVWRDFAHHLAYHTPHLTSGNWRPEWDAFPWRGDNAQAEAWRRGRTGIEVVDAGMREMYVTGRMHNRARMLVASYLTKHLMTHWRVGCDWFADCLIDWDPASNAMGWQWAAGSGPDAAPFFRIFNPETQGEKFDPKGRYRRRWVAELPGPENADALAFYDAIPRSWDMGPGDAYPTAPIVGLSEGRQRALDAYAQRDATE